MVYYVTLLKMFLYIELIQHLSTIQIVILLYRLQSQQDTSTVMVISVCTESRTFK